MAEPDPAHRLAIRGWRLLSNGMGGLDWAGLPTVIALLGIDDPEPFIHQLMVLKTHRPPEQP